MVILGKERDYIIHDENKINGFFGEYRWLSNFHVADVWYEGLLYPSTEHAYQAAKSLDENVRKEFLTLTCSESKHRGQKIKLREDWDIIKYDIMFAVVFDKFSRHKDLRKKLLETGDKYLEETNHWKDVFWGKCNNFGDNNLGKILMNIRNIIRSNPAYTKTSQIFL